VPLFIKGKKKAESLKRMMLQLLPPLKSKKISSEINYNTVIIYKSNKKR